MKFKHVDNDFEFATKSRTIDYTNPCDRSMFFRGPRNPLVVITHDLKARDLVKTDIFVLTRNH